jgi:hypothetical protein
MICSMHGASSRVCWTGQTSRSRLCRVHCDVTGRSRDVPLPDGLGFLLPRQRSDEVVLYGPGANGFQMSRWHSSGRQLAGLIRYTHPDPPILAERGDVIQAAFSGGNLCGEITWHGEPVGDTKLLGAPATAGARACASVPTCTAAKLAVITRDHMHSEPKAGMAG